MLPVGRRLSVPVLLAGRLHLGMPLRAICPYARSAEHRTPMVPLVVLLVPQLQAALHLRSVATPQASNMLPASRRPDISNLVRPVMANLLRQAVALLECILPALP